MKPLWPATSIKRPRPPFGHPKWEFSIFLTLIIHQEELLEVVTFHLPPYNNTINKCETSPGQVNPSHLTFPTKICSHVPFHQGERIASYDLLLLNCGHGQCREGKWGFHWSENIQDCCQVWIWFLDSDQCKRAITRWLHQFLSAITKTWVRDPDFKFQGRRTTDSVKKRASLKMPLDNRGTHTRQKTVSLHQCCNI